MGNNVNTGTGPELREIFDTTSNLRPAKIDTVRNKSSRLGPYRRVQTTIIYCNFIRVSLQYYYCYNTG